MPELEEVDPTTLDLAAAVSLAVRIEPQLLRAARLRLCPRLPASSEAHVWWSELVVERTPLGIVFARDALAELRARLRERGWIEPAWQLVRAAHEDRIAPALFLEEELAYLDASGADRAHLERALHRVLAALEQPERDGLARWARRALIRVPRSVHGADAYEALRARVESSGGAVDQLPNAETSRLLALTETQRAALGDVRLGVRIDGSTLSLGESVYGEGAVEILVPATTPRLVLMRWLDGAASTSELLRVEAGAAVSIHGISAEGTELVTAAGEVYSLRDLVLPPVELTVRLIEARSEAEPWPTALVVHAEDDRALAEDIVRRLEGARTKAERRAASVFQSEALLLPPSAYGVVVVLSSDRASAEGIDAEYVSTMLRSWNVLVARFDDTRHSPEAIAVDLRATDASERAAKIAGYATSLAREQPSWLVGALENGIPRLREEGIRIDVTGTSVWNAEELARAAQDTDAVLLIVDERSAAEWANFTVHPLPPDSSIASKVLPLYLGREEAPAYVDLGDEPWVQLSRDGEQSLDGLWDLIRTQLPSHLRGVPPPPEHYVARPAAEALVRDWLLGQLGAPAYGPLILRGPPGVGKRTLVSAIARDPRVRRAFPGGIVWDERVVDDWSYRRLVLRDSEHRATLFVLPRLRPKAGWRALGPLESATYGHRVLVIVDGESDEDVSAGLEAPPFEIDEAVALMERAGAPRQAIDALAEPLREHPGLLFLVSRFVRASERTAGLDPAQVRVSIEEGVPLAEAVLHGILDRLRKDERLTKLSGGVPLDRLLLDLVAFRRGAFVRASLLVSFLSSRYPANVHGQRVLSAFTELGLSMLVEGDPHEATMWRLDDELAALPVERRTSDGDLIEHFAREGYTSLESLWNGYFPAHLSYHLARAGADVELRQLWSNLLWLDRRVRKEGVSAVLADLDAHHPAPHESPLAYIEAAREALADDPTQLIPQLCGRASNALRGALDDRPSWWPARPLLLPTFPSLIDAGLPAGAAMLDVAVQSDEAGHVVVSRDERGEARVSRMVDGEAVTIASKLTSAIAIEPGDRWAYAEAGGAVGVGDLREGTWLPWARVDGEVSAVHFLNIDRGELLVELDGGPRQSFPRQLPMSFGGGGPELWWVNEHEARRVTHGRVADVQSGRAPLVVVDDDLAILRIDGGDVSRFPSAHGGARVTVATWTSEGRVISGGDDHFVRVWDPTTRVCLSALAGHRAPVTHVVAIDRRIVSADADGTVRIWDDREGRRSLVLSHAASVTAVVAHLASDRLLTASRDRTVRWWELSTGRELCRFTADAPITAASLDSAGRTIVAGDASGRVHVLDVWEPTATGAARSSNLFEDDRAHRYFNPPDAVPRLGRALRRGSFDELLAQLEDGELLLGYGDPSSAHSAAAHITSEARMDEIERSWTPRYYAVHVEELLSAGELAPQISERALERLLARAEEKTMEA